MFSVEEIAQILAGERKPQRTSRGFLTTCPTHADRNFSLSISETPEGRLLFHCFAGCAQETLTAWFKTRGYLSSNGKNGKGHNAQPEAPKPRIVATYDYLDAGGKLVFQVVRLEPGKDGKKKDFRQRRPDGSGWVWNLRGVTRVPYRLPNVLKSKNIFIGEGEKVVHALEALGLTATTNPGGAGKWRPEFNQYFQEKRVVILPDNDEPGRAHAQDVARNLHGVAESIKVVELPGLPAKGDACDWVAAGGTIEKLQALVEAAPEYKPTAGDNTNTPICRFSLSDLGNGQRLAALHGRDLRFCHAWDKWFIWDGCRWAPDETGEIDRRAKDTVRSIYGEAATAISKNDREALAAHALRSESEGKRRAMIASAKSETGIPIRPDDFDRDPWLLNVQNGTLDLRTGELRPHRREDLITKLAPVKYDPEAECPVWWAFLERIFAGNFQLIDFVQRSVGYSLTGSTREQCLFFLYGLGANGKSTLLEVFHTLMGDYATRTPTDTFLTRKNSTIPNDLAGLRGARLVTAVEVEHGRRLAEVIIKETTGGDRITARFLHSEFFTFKPQFKIFLAANHKPVIRGTDYAIWRRIHLIPFNVQIPPAEQDPDLPEKLKAELPGILNWALEGCLLWQDKRLWPPEEVRAATQKYREEMDVLADFLAERCIVGPGEKCKAGELYQAYKDWAEHTGESRPLSLKAFGLLLEERGFTAKKGTAGVIYRHGVGLKG